MSPGGVNETIRAMMGAVKRAYVWSNNPTTTAGTTTAYTLSYTVAPSALYDGMLHVVAFNATCGASPTLNINSLGAKPLHYFTGSTWAVVPSGFIISGMICPVVYNSSAGTYRIVSFPSAAGATTAGGNNAFTGNNTFAGTSTFNGAVTAASTATFTGGLTATSGTNSFTGTLGSASVGTTQSALDNSTKIATTAYADRAGVRQVVKSFVNTYSTTAGTGITADNSIPQLTEGDQILSLAITPKSATSTLIIEVGASLARANTDYVTMALFQDSTANALAAVVNHVNGSYPNYMTLRWVMTSGTTSATTFKVRAGSDTPSALYVNGNSGGALMGGVMGTNITITEVGG